MAGEFILPGTIVGLKFLLKLFLNQEVDRVKFFQAAIQFPIDLAFLAFSFSAASIIATAWATNTTVDAKTNLAAILLYLVVAVIVIIVCKFSENAFISENTKFPWILTIPSYLISILTLSMSFKVGEFL